MKKRNILATVAAVGLCVATAAPAAAFENEFHGMFSARYINSNFNRTETTDYNGLGDGNYDPTGKNKKQFSANFIEQRARLKYIAKANADLKLVTQFELDYAYWGNNSYTTARNGGAALGADTINIETKSIYLDANPAKNLNMKLGMMPNNDAFKGILFDADMAGIMLSSNYGKFAPSIGYYRFNDNGANKDKVLGHNTNDLFMLDGKYEVSKNLKLGAAYYFFRDNQAQTGKPNNDVKISSFGLNGEYVSGPLTLSGFLIYQTGWNNLLVGKKTYVNAFAGNIGAKVNAGPGTARAELLYVSGSDDGKNSFYSVDAENGYYSNEMVMLGRDKNAYTTDNAIIFDGSNKGQGQIGAYFGYDLPVTPKLSTAANLGFAWVAHRNAKSYSQSNSKFLGTEINAEANYQILDGFTAGVRAGYVFLGGQFDNVALGNKTPVNPYDAKLIFTYSF